MESADVYIPLDRRQAIANNEDLPNRTSGAALFANMSGSMQLTETLLKEYNPQRSAEELSHLLNRVYDSLIAEIHSYGGIVISFGGDALTCWFEGDDGLYATACAFAMQQAMGQVEPLETPSGASLALSLKVAVASGPARRFQVGNPNIQLIDVLAGTTLSRMAEAGDVTRPGDVVLSEEVIKFLGDKVNIVEWRSNPGTGLRFGVVTELSGQGQVSVKTRTEPFPSQHLTEDQIRPWLLPPVYERLQAGRGEFLAELRPVVVLFLGFSGIDYDADERTGEKLDAYIRWVQAILGHYEGYLLQLIIGDKGSHLYAAFGAPVVHGDDAVRAVRAALDLRAIPQSLSFIKPVKMGISQGQMWTGAYGGSRRRTYGTLGDDVNLAAKLMHWQKKQDEQREPKEQEEQKVRIIASRAIQKATAKIFNWPNLPDLTIEGKVEPIPAFILGGMKESPTNVLLRHDYALEMVGRKAELTLIEQALRQVLLTGQGQILAITGEAGIGKSRLVGQLIDLANRQQLAGYMGKCESYGINASYLVWQPIWRDFFDLDPADIITDDKTVLETTLKEALEFIDPYLAPHLPLLGEVLNLPLSDNNTTSGFDAEYRKIFRERLLVECLRGRASDGPLLLILEDIQWLDPLSRDLLKAIGQHLIDNLPVLIVVTYRPPELPYLAQLPNFTKIQLAGFTPDEAKQMIQIKLDQFADPWDKESLALLVERIIELAEGNPFYLEEFLNYLHDQGINPQATEQFDLPPSIHRLVLDRINQLILRQQTMLKVASIIGRRFRTIWLRGMFPGLGTPLQVKEDLETLTCSEPIVLNELEPERRYSFRHDLIHEVVYQSQPHVTRAKLHEQLAQYIERTYSDNLARYFNALAHHYELGENKAKARTYLRKAAEVAKANYANESAIDYYQRLLPLLDPDEETDVMLELGKILQLIGQWEEAGQHYRQALELAEQASDARARARSQAELGELCRKQNSFDEASSWLEQAQAGFEALNDQVGLGQVLHYRGNTSLQQDDYEEARGYYERSLAIREALADELNEANLHSNLGLIAFGQDDFEKSRFHLERSLELRRKLGDKRAISISLNNLAELERALENYAKARSWLEEAVTLKREVGDMWSLANALTTLGDVLRDQGDYTEARDAYTESLTLTQRLGDEKAIAYILQSFSILAERQGQPERALYLYGVAKKLRESLSVSLPPAVRQEIEQSLVSARQAFGEPEAASVIAEGKAGSLEPAIDYALAQLVRLNISEPQES